MENEITITGMTRMIHPKPNKGGSTILAHFDCLVPGLILRGCAFVRTSRNGLTVWPPKLDRPEERRSVTISCASLIQALTRAAQETYRGLGGTDGEWLPYGADKAIPDRLMPGRPPSQPQENNHG